VTVTACGEGLDGTGAVVVPGCLPVPGLGNGAFVSYYRRSAVAVVQCSDRQGAAGGRDG